MEGERGGWYYHDRSGERVQEVGETSETRLSQIDEF